MKAQACKGGNKCKVLQGGGSVKESGEIVFLLSSLNKTSPSAVTSNNYIQFKLTFLSVINIKVLVLKITVINYYYYYYYLTFVLRERDVFSKEEFWDTVYYRENVDNPDLNGI